MIKVHKDLESIPSSLMDKKTNRKRDNCIKDEKYHQKKDFHQQFKQQDVKDTLRMIYNEKCAFCEQKITECKDNNLEDCSQTIEHYRPKIIYYWLAYSWDNLLWCCHRCNQNKHKQFETASQTVKYDKTFLENIHTSTSIYQEIEKPKMIHPELESVVDKLNFYDGKIDSDDERVKYTINICKLDRDALNDTRQTIIDDFMEVLIDKKLKNESFIEDLQNLMNVFKNKNSEFRALRYWMLRHYEDLLS